MVSIKIILICILCFLLVVAIRLHFGYRLSVKTTNLIHAYNQLCWLEDKYECILHFDEAEKPTWYQIFCPWVVTVQQCLTQDAWEKVKSVKNKEKEIIAAANKRYNELCEEIERLNNVI